MNKYKEVKGHLDVCQKIWEEVYDDSPEVDDWAVPISGFEANIHMSLKNIKDALEILNEELLKKRK